MSRVTFVIMDVGPVGGMERQATEILRGLVADGHEVTVLARTCEDVPGVRFARVPTPMRPFSIAFPLWILWASVMVARIPSDLVHVNGAIVLNRADVITIHFCHRAYQASFTLAERTRAGLTHRVNARVVSALARAMEAWCLRPGRAKDVVAISAGVGREVERWYPRRRDTPTIIRYGVDGERFRPSPEDRTRMRAELGLPDDALLAVFVGGEWERKGLQFALDAVVRRPRWHLVVAGDGDRATYSEQAGNAADRLHFVGRVDPAPLYAAGDAFVFPTAYETFSLVTHEAAAAGLPLLVTRVSGPDELIEPGVQGWFVERDGPAIAACLAELEASPELRQAVGVAARSAVAPLTWERARADHAALYRKALATSPRRVPIQ